MVFAKCEFVLTIVRDDDSVVVVVVLVLIIVGSRSVGGLFSEYLIVKISSCC